MENAHTFQSKISEHFYLIGNILSTNIQLPHGLTSTRPHVGRRRPRNIHILPFLSLLLDRSLAGMFAALVFLGLDFLLLGGFGGVGLFLNLLPLSGVGEFVLDWVQQTTEGRVDGRFELFVISIGLVAI